MKNPGPRPPRPRSPGTASGVPRNRPAARQFPKLGQQQTQRRTGVTKSSAVIAPPVPGTDAGQGDDLDRDTPKAGEHLPATDGRAPKQTQRTSVAETKQPQPGRGGYPASGAAGAPTTPSERAKTATKALTAGAKAGAKVGGVAGAVAGALGNTVRAGAQMSKQDRAAKAGGVTRGAAKRRAASLALKGAGAALVPLAPYLAVTLALFVLITGLSGVSGQEETSQSESSEAVATSGGPTRAEQAHLADRTRGTGVPWQVLAALLDSSGSAAGPSGVAEVIEPDDLTCPETGHVVEEGLVANALLVYRCGQAQFPQVTSWIGVADRPSNPDSDHPAGRAVDAMIPGWDNPSGNDLGWQVADFYQMNAAVLGVKYIIWDAQVWSGQTWEPYSHPSGSSGATLDHLDHVHVSVSSSSDGVEGGGTPSNNVGIGAGSGPYNLSEDADLSADEAQDINIATDYVASELNRLLQASDRGSLHLGAGAVVFDNGTKGLPTHPDEAQGESGQAVYNADYARDAQRVEETYVAAIAELPIEGMDEARAQEVFVIARDWYLGIENQVGPGQCLISGDGVPEHLEGTDANGTTINLGADQLQMSAQIIGKATETGAGTAGARVALITALQESTLRNLANDGSFANLTAAEREVVLESLDYPHDGIGSDWDSVNAFQQRPSQGWGTVAELMDPDYAASMFFERLLSLEDFESMPAGAAAQAVQISAYPDAYDRWLPVADAILDVVSGSACRPSAGEFSPDGWTSPLPGATLTSGFDMGRIHPIFGQAMPHYGTDLSHPVGTSILAANDGVVIDVSGCQSGCTHSDYWVTGYVVAIDHGGGVVTTYNHVLASVPVSVGDEVNGGDEVAQVGLSGNTTGAHLHFQIIIDEDFIDPEIVYDEAGISINDGGPRW